MKYENPSETPSDAGSGGIPFNEVAKEIPACNVERSKPAGRLRPCTRISAGLRMTARIVYLCIDNNCPKCYTILEQTGSTSHDYHRTATKF